MEATLSNIITFNPLLIRGVPKNKIVTTRIEAACLENRGSVGPLDYTVKGLPKTFLLLKI